jgi:hypothetical protein
MRDKNIFATAVQRQPVYRVSKNAGIRKMAIHFRKLAL